MLPPHNTPQRKGNHHLHNQQRDMAQDAFDVLDDDVPLICIVFCSLDAAQRNQGLHHVLSRPL